MRGSFQEVGVRAEDEASFREFAVAQWGILARQAYLMVGDVGYAEDLVQTVLAKIWRVWGRIAEEAPEAYARKALANAATSWWRRRWHGERPVETLPEHGYEHDGAAQLSDRLELARALAELSPRQRAAVVLRFAEDLSEAQVAEAMDCSIGTVKSLSSRGLARLREATAGRSGQPVAKGAARR